MINTPQENPNIPSELVNQLNAIRNQISLGEAEVSRLNALATSSQYTVNQAVIDLKDLEERIAIKSRELAVLLEDVTEQTDKRDKLVTTQCKLNDDIHEKTATLAHALADFESKQADVATGRAQLDTDIAKLNADKKEFELEVKAHQSKVEKLKKAIE